MQRCNELPGCLLHNCAYYLHHSHCCLGKGYRVVSQIFDGWYQLATDGHDLRPIISVNYGIHVTPTGFCLLIVAFSTNIAPLWGW